MTESELVEASGRNAAAALKHFTRSSGGSVEEEAGILLAASPNPYCGPFHNAAVRLDQESDPGWVLRRADEFFGARRRGYILWIAPGKDADLENNAVTAGMALRRPAAGAPDMVVTAPLAPVKPPDGVTVIHVTTADQTATFGEIVAGAYAAREEPSPSLHGDSKEAPGVTDDVTGVPAVDGEPQPLAAAMTMFSNPSALLAPEAYAVIACLEGEPVSCAVQYQSDDVAGVYWVSTLRAARRRGLAELVTQAVVNQGFRRGARVVTLQASSMGDQLYRRMGFTEIGRHRRYIRTRPTDSLAQPEA